ncbi:pyridoxal-phosphate dependent enzyme [Nocardioides sp. HDW12B]|uniref:pyridoxal-phosphate dependent enzyme n=1 Tax=Nocardioides sp. HDW12B TaxID=2714939 RepID=UPI001409A8B9|nr:pyridoxal-phosphate dependent enzyme [Nocardioides sp. HDW12B]QIK65346.1 pyridoxal-phosphate dependent enzyme [Nocardioides sp. HDW12B]
MTERLTLATWPTPLEPAPRLATALGLAPDDLWVKRDDLVGLGGGGNKVRKLEATLAEALAQGATAVVTSGAAQSNHARLTAAAGARLGLEVTLVLAGEPPEPPERSTGNLLLDELLGARLVWAGATSLADLDAVVEQEAARLRSAGTPTYVVPYGGSNVAGAGAYAEAGHEILGQAPDTSLVVAAVGSGGTMAGLVHALGVDRVLGVDTGAVPDPGDRVAQLLAGLGTPVASADLRLRRDLVGEGYGVLSAEVRAAMELVARTEGIVLDPVYTGRAAAGLVAGVREGVVVAGRRTVLLHSGGLPGLFGHLGATDWS